MRRKQYIIIELELQPEQEPYRLTEDHGVNGPYAALRHFFEDIDFRVTRLVSGAEPGIPFRHIESSEGPGCVPTNWATAVLAIANSKAMGKAPRKAAR